MGFLEHRAVSQEILTKASTICWQCSRIIVNIFFFILTTAKVPLLVTWEITDES